MFYKNFFVFIVWTFIFHQTAFAANNKIPPIEKYDSAECGIVEMHKHYIREAIKEAEKAIKMGDEPFAAILVDKKGKVLHKARNHTRSKHNMIKHAEMEILEAIDQRHPEKYEGSILYTSTEPCPMCTATIARMHEYVGKIVYGCTMKTFARHSKKKGSVLSSTKLLSLISSRVSVEGPILEKEAELVHQNYWGEAEAD